MHGTQKKVFFVPLRLWSIGCILGILCAMVISDSMGEILKEYLQTRMQVTITTYDWFRCLWMNGRFMALLGIITYMPYEIVWLQTAMAAYGFFFGFSIQVLARAYGFSGIAGALCSYIPHNLFLLPVIFSVVINMENKHRNAHTVILWSCIVIMAVLSTIVEIKTAPLLMKWCLGGIS